MGAVAVGVHQGVGRVAKDARAQIRVRGIHARVIDVHQHVGAGQAQVVVGGQRVRWRRRCVTRLKSLAGARAERPFHLLHAGQPGDGGQARPRGGTHSQHRPKRGTALRRPRSWRPASPSPRGSVWRASAKSNTLSALFVGQGRLRHRQLQQRRLELVIGLVGQNGLRLRVGLQLLRHRRRGADEIGVVGDVGNDGGPGGLQQGAEGVVNRPAGLDQVAAGIALGAQMIGDRRGGLGGVEQRVFEQDGLSLRCNWLRGAVVLLRRRAKRFVLRVA